jgi:hypothetical protein
MTAPDWGLCDYLCQRLVCAGNSFSLQRLFCVRAGYFEFLPGHSQNIAATEDSLGG